MGAVKLELRCPQGVNGVVADPLLDWSFNALISELNALELKLESVPFTKTRSRALSPIKKMNRRARAFVMHVSDDELEDIDIEREEGDQSLVEGTQFACDELSLSDSDDPEDGSGLEVQLHLMNIVELVEGALFELTHEHQLGVKEENRNQVSALEMELMNESDNFASSLTRVEKYSETRLEVDRRLNTHYRCKIAEALDSHLTAVQRDHEHWSQIEERKIRNDAAIEEAKRKEKVLQEEKLRQEKSKAEAEAQLVAAKKRAEEAKIASLEAERKAAKEAAEKVARETLERAVTAEVGRMEAGVQETDVRDLNVQAKGSGFDGLKKVQSTGNVVRSVENALKLEEIRLLKYKEIDQMNQALISGSNKDFQNYERQIARRIKQTSGTEESVRSLHTLPLSIWSNTLHPITCTFLGAKANELMKIFNDPLCSQSISISMFAAKVVSLCENPGSAAFALGHVIVLVTSKFPLAMDLVLAEFHRACIYTVPKHVTYSASVFETKEAYKKSIGFRLEDGKIESIEQYLQRLESYMKLYGALVQIEIEGVQNSHGLKEGWAWLARFLNALPANIYTGTALEAFLRMAGFALFRKYKSQFKKILNIISRDFVAALKARRDSKLNLVITRIESYMETNQFLQEPEGWRLSSSALSSSLVPESDYREPYYHQQKRFYY